MPKQGLISIIIPTKNESKNLPRCLRSIRNNGYPKYEVIIVDQRSIDGTIEVARKFKAKVIQIPDSNTYQPPSQSRNVGFKESRGEIIYHLDADMELEPGLLSEIAELFSKPEISAAIVPETDIPGNLWAQGKALERSMYVNTAMEAARVSRRKVFADTGYDPQIISGEDWHIHRRFSQLGRIARTQKIVRHHIGSLSLKREFSKKVQYGQASGNFVEKNISQLTTMFVKLAWTYAKGVYTQIFTQPKVVVAFLVIRVVDLAALVWGYLVSTYRKWYFVGEKRNNLSPQQIPTLTGRLKYSVELLSCRKRRVLIIGDSYGWYAQAALVSGATKVVSIDLAAPSTQALSLQKDYPDFSHSVTDLFNYSTKDKFDICVFLEVIEHLPVNTELIALKKIRNFLSPRGMLLISTPVKSILSYLSDPISILGHRHYSQNQLENLLKEAGFKKNSFFRGGYLISAIDILSLYFTKWILRQPYNSRWAKRINSEYPHPQGITLFAISQP